MPGSIGSDRFVQVGVNSAGDPMYARAGSGAVSVVDVEYESMTKAELSEEAEHRGLAKSGSKAELVARLQEDDG